MEGKVRNADDLSRKKQQMLDLGEKVKTKDSTSKAKNEKKGRKSGK